MINGGKHGVVRPCSASSRVPVPVRWRFVIIVFSIHVQDYGLPCLETISPVRV